MKNSVPDFIIDQITCGCELPMCPMCDPDFHLDLEWDLDLNFEPPF